jgi:V8-like Glu-specific endopeptidase
MVGRTGAGAPWGPVCTGTLIAPDIVLTVGHCVLLAGLFEGYSEFGVTFAPQFSPAA